MRHKNPANVVTLEQVKASEKLSDLTRQLENLKPALAEILNGPESPCRNRVLGEVSNLSHVLYCTTIYTRGVRYHV
jgi:hypothetical protein